MAANAACGQELQRAAAWHAGGNCKRSQRGMRTRIPTGAKRACGQAFPKDINVARGREFQGAAMQNVGRNCSGVKGSCGHEFQWAEIAMDANAACAWDFQRV